MDGVSEQLKRALDSLQWQRAAECFAPLAEEAKTSRWDHVEYLGKAVAEQAAATVNRRLATRLRYARFPFRRTIDHFDFHLQPSTMSTPSALLRASRNWDKSD